MATRSACSPVLSLWTCLLLTTPSTSPPTPPQQGARDDWRRTPDRRDTQHAGKQTQLCAAAREEESLATKTTTTTKRTTTGKCTGTDVVQHLHQRPAVHADTRCFIYADDLSIASQRNDFNNIEASLTSALITTYYDTNQLRANHSKRHVCAFRLRNREANRELNVVWNGTRLSNTTTPGYIWASILTELGAIKRKSRRKR